ncbi:MAG: VOC family protein [Actinophytocola sp.]|uniref:VOC family protein n=1 Tax=Actinophytocola sp. TaxID=1872138 RepID=UPI0013257F03|nr:VOC family protein [Actinophytocola sp.]MPZ80123.1 VOC family protein [Actinophytocola sp.]
MLTKSMITTMLPVSDVERAGQFYGDTLGLHQKASGADGSLVFDAGNGDAIGLMPAEAGAQSEHTVLSFEVTDISGEIRDLERRGVTFADYDQPDLRTVDHIAELGNEKAAWFSDSEGNILCIHEVLG